MTEALLGSLGNQETHKSPRTLAPFLTAARKGMRAMFLVMAGITIITLLVRWGIGNNYMEIRYMETYMLIGPYMLTKWASIMIGFTALSVALWMLCLAAETLKSSHTLHENRVNRR